MGEATISLDPDVRYQTMTGWEVLSPPVRDWPVGIDTYLPALLDAVVEAGVNRIRLESHHLFHHVESVNDNPDPQVIDWAGFDFTVFDREVEKLILPLRQRLAARGERLIVNLNTVDIGNSDNLFHRDPNEFAEFILAHFLHMQSDYGFVPDIVEVSLEPDVFQTFPTAVSLAAALVAAGDRLQANGFGIVRFSAPSMSTLPGSITWFNNMVNANIPNLFTYLTEASYHRYSVGSEIPNLETFAARAAQQGVTTAMLEWWTSANGYETLHKDLTSGMVSAWQQAGPGAPPATFTSWGAMRLFGVDDQVSPPSLIVNPETKFLRQYYRHVREGAVRIEATSTNDALAPLAFVNLGGEYTVVVKAASSATFSVGLPPGTYGIFYTTHSDCGNDTEVAQYDVQRPDVSIPTGVNLLTTIPACGVMTIYGKG